MDISKALTNYHVQRIIRSLNIHCSDKTSHNDRYSFLENICNVCYEGETKIVLLHDDWDFVIKIPKYHNYRKFNYCDLEVQHYQSALKYRVEKVLLETAVLTTLSNGITLYIQPRYHESLNDFWRNNNKYNSLQKKLNNTDYKSPTRRKALLGMYESYRLDCEWFCRLVQLYGKKFARSLEQWSQENKIGDLHSSNVGWYNNKPIILDYSGYYGGRYW